MGIPQFVHFSVTGHLDGFQVSTDINKMRVSSRFRLFKKEKRQSKGNIRGKNFFHSLS